MLHCGWELYMGSAIAFATMAVPFATAQGRVHMECRAGQNGQVRASDLQQGLF